MERSKILTPDVSALAFFVCAEAVSGTLDVTPSRGSSIICVLDRMTEIGLHGFILSCLGMLRNVFV